MKTRPVKKRISSLRITFKEGVALPRNINRYYEKMKLKIKYSNPLLIRRKEKRRKIIYWGRNHAKWKRPIK